MVGMVCYRFKYQIVTTSTLTIPPRAIICELQPVSVDMTYQLSKPDESSTSVLGQVKVETEGISEDEKKCVLISYTNMKIFSQQVILT